MKVNHSLFKEEKKDGHVFVFETFDMSQNGDDGDTKRLSITSL